MSTRKLSETLSILIPMYNEEDTIGDTLKKLINSNSHKRYKIIICDDASEDKSVKKVKCIAREHDISLSVVNDNIDSPGSENDNSICVVCREKNGKKVGAIKTGLKHIKTPYVFQMDADSMIETTTGSSDEVCLDEVLDELVEKMCCEDLVSIGFKIRPPATKIIEYLQALEYILFTDSVRQLLEVTVCLVGQGVLWKVESLENVLKDHSGIFEGDDLESTMIATWKNLRVSYETRKAIVTTKLKKNLWELIKQRTCIWDLGLIRTFVDARKTLKQKSAHGIFFRSILITEVLAHPFKVLSIVGLFFILLSVLLGSLTEIPSNFLLSRFKEAVYLNEFVLRVLRNTSVVYIILWLLNTVSIILASCSVWRSIGKWRLIKKVFLWFFYFTCYMATPLIPLVVSDFGQALGFTYLWWYAFCAIMILLGSEPWRDKVRWLIWGLLMPFYYAFLLALPRTLGFGIYITGRILNSCKKLLKSEEK